MVGIALLAVVSVALAAVVAGGLAAVDAGDPPPRAAMDVDADADSDRISVTHVGGSAIDPGTVSVRVVVDGDPLERQPPVPFFSARGFVSGPSGPFNPAWRGDWTAGETASLRVAGTNDPGGLDGGAAVSVVLRSNGRVIAEQKTVAR